MNVVEIVTFPCSEAFIVDRAKVLGPAPEASMKSPGCLQYAVSRGGPADADYVEPTMLYRSKRKMISMWVVSQQVDALDHIRDSD
jgi:hypothetical protein